MTKTVTPICDLIERLLSQGVSHKAALAAGRDIEAPPTGSDPAEERRKRSRERQQRARAKKRDRHGDSHATLLSSLPSDSDSKVKEERKESSVTVTPKVTPSDDWPEDYENLFWSNYPEGRKYDRKSVFRKLAKIRAEGVSWVKLFEAVLRFAMTKPDPQFTAAPMVWLNQARWEAKIVTKGNGNAQGRGSDNAGVDPIAAAAARRFGGQHGPMARPAGEASHSDEGRPADGGRAKGSGGPVVDADYRVIR